MRSYYEFFAGGGMARSGLGSGWNCTFANDFDPKKAASYAVNWGASALLIADIASVAIDQLPGSADLAWASFPCQDLSLAGAGAGLLGARSGTFWPFWKLIQNLNLVNRAPRLIVLENVCGALTSHDGRDFANICDALANEGYAFGAVVIDAVRFVPQSRPRLFIIGTKSDDDVVQGAIASSPNPMWHNRALMQAHTKLSDSARASWRWWNLPAPEPQTIKFADLIEESPSGVEWHSIQETTRLLSLMSDIHIAKVDAATRIGQRQVGALYKRTRPDGQGGRIQRAEVRFDDIAGCLRTPTGGSSRQFVLIVEGESVRSRLLSPREAARLMGLPDAYRLPNHYNEAYHLAGDGLVVPVVRFLAEHLLEPLLADQEASPISEPRLFVSKQRSISQVHSRLPTIELVGD